VLETTHDFHGNHVSRKPSIETLTQCRCLHVINVGLSLYYPFLPPCTFSSGVSGRHTSEKAWAGTRREQAATVRQVHGCWLAGAVARVRRTAGECAWLPVGMCDEHLLQTPPIETNSFLPTPNLQFLPPSVHRR
jgi:hypothetical protein